MPVLKILTESIHLLRKEPKLFIPRLITTALYSVVLLYAAKITADMIMITGASQDSMAALDPQLLTPLVGGLIMLLFALVVLLVVDLVSYAMYPAMIKDHHSKNKISFGKSLKEALSAWKMILVLWTLIMGFSLLLGATMFVFEALMMETGNQVYYYMSTGIVLLAVLILLILLFFVMPVAVVEKKGVFNSFSEGFKLSFKHKRDVVAINVFFIILTIATMMLMTFSQINYSGEMMLLALSVFILTRIFEAVIYTYISVVNPYFYMRIR